LEEIMGSRRGVESAEPATENTEKGDTTTLDMSEPWAGV
jgi:hypothetical protein